MFGLYTKYSLKGIVEIYFILVTIFLKNTGSLYIKNALTPAYLFKSGKEVKPEK